MSSSSIVCQRSQAAGLEPRRLVEPRVVRLKAAPPICSFFHSPAQSNPRYDHRHETSVNNLGEDVGAVVDKPEELDCWNFIQSLSNKNRAETEVNDTHKVYFQPLIEPTSAKLSEKSLEMCTEGLGNETGNNVIENMEDISLLSLGAKREASKMKDNNENQTHKPSRKRLSRTTRFPPPIRSISSSATGLRVKSHREGGRLVLEASFVTSSASCFHVERSEGRLRLCLLKDSCFNSDDETVIDSASELLKEEEREGLGKGMEEQEEEGEEEEGIKAIKEKAGDKTGIEKTYGLSRRCKSGGGNRGRGRGGSGGGGGGGQKGLVNWEPVVVAT